jgi:hypothetical protein
LHGIAAPAAASVAAGAACWFGGFDVSACFDSSEVAVGFDSSDGASGFDASALMAMSTARSVGVAASAVSEGFALDAVCEGSMSPSLTGLSCGSAVPAAKQPSAPATIKTDLRCCRPPCRIGAAAGLRGIVVNAVREAPTSG